MAANTSRNLLILDVSKSMQLEDYQPSRMHAVLEGVSQFLSLRKECDIQVAIFGGNALLLEVSNDRACYSKEKLDSVFFLAKTVKRGSSISDAIMLGNMLTECAEKLENIVIIGDGDDTFGFAPEMPIHIAKLRHIIH